MSAAARVPGPPRRREVPWGDVGRWTLLVLLGVAALVDLLVAPHNSSVEGAGLGVYAWVATAAYAIPGTVLLVRRRWHPVGWLLVVYGVLMAVSFSGDWAMVATGGPWLRLLVDRVQGSLFWLPIVCLLVWFPEGLRERPPRQRLVGRSLIAGASIASGVELLARTVSLDSGFTEPSPLGPFAVVPEAVAETMFLVTLATLVGAVIGLVRRYRAAASSTRLQYRWVVTALVLLLLALAFALTLTTITGEAGTWWIAILLAYLVVPVAFTIAISRYRLYDLDRLVSRTVSYAVVLMVLGGAYLVAVTGLAALLPTQDRVAVAVTTVAVVALFNPVRGRVVDAVDRRFDRTRYQARQVVEQFGRTIRDETELDAVRGRLRDVIGRTTAPTTIALWEPMAQPVTKDHR